MTESDFKAWRRGPEGRGNTRLRLYPDLNHVLMEGTGKATPDEYARPGHVARSVIEDIAAWIAAVPPNLLVVDLLRGSGRNRFEIVWHLAPGLHTRVAGPARVAARGGGPACLWFDAAATSELGVGMAEGEEDPIQGWHSPSYGVTLPAPIVVYGADAEAPRRERESSGEHGTRHIDPAQGSSDTTRRNLPFGPLSIEPLGSGPRLRATGRRAAFWAAWPFHILPHLCHHRPDVPSQGSA